MLTTTETSEEKRIILKGLANLYEKTGEVLKAQALREQATNSLVKNKTSKELEPLVSPQFIPYHNSKPLQLPHNPIHPAVTSFNNGHPANTIASSSEESTLFNLINDYRVQNGFSVIPYSEALTQTAHAHVEDLATNSPMQGKCGIFSWSNKGHWTPVCYTHDGRSSKLMWSKPSEIADYKGNGYEIAHWGNDTSVQETFNRWISQPQARQLFLNNGHWNGRNWQALGIGIKDGYVVVWLGEELDKPNGIIPVSLQEQPSLSIDSDEYYIAGEAEYGHDWKSVQFFKLTQPLTRPLKVYIQSYPNETPVYKPIYLRLVKESFQEWANALDNRLTYVWTNDKSQADITIEWVDHIVGMEEHTAGLTQAQNGYSSIKIIGQQSPDNQIKKL